MFKGLLDSAIESIDALDFFYTRESNFLLDCFDKEAEKYCFAFEASLFLDLAFKESLSEKEKHMKQQLANRVGKYIIISEDQSERDKGILKYQTTNLEELTAKNVETDIAKGRKQYTQYIEMFVLHDSNALIMLITRFEEFISAYLEILFDKFPEKYIDKQNVSFKDIRSLQDAEQIKKLIIQREVEKYMRQEYSSWFKLLEEHGLKFDSIASFYKKLSEIYARRNIWVHNSGYVNSSYLSLVPDTPYKLDERTRITSEYISNAIHVIKTIIYAIMLETNRLIQRSDQANYLHDIFVCAFESLLAKEYDICSYVYGRLKSNKMTSENDRLMAQVNYWISEIAINGLPKYKSEIDEWDVSASDKAFRLAKNMLLEQYEEATYLLTYLYEHHELEAEEIKTWPLFEEYRKSEYYQSFVEQHKCDFHVSSYEANDKALDSNMLLSDLSGDDNPKESADAEKT